MRIIILEHDCQFFKGLAVITLLLGIASSAYAEVYKCNTASKQIVYQPMPCPSGTVNQNKVEIEKLTPQQLEDVQKRLKATEAEQQAEQARQDAAAARWQAEAPLREAEAARREAEAARREAAEAKQQAATPAPYPVYIPYPNYGYHYPQQPIYNPNYNHPYSQNSTYNTSPRYNYGLEPVNPNGISLYPNPQLKYSSPQPMIYPPTTYTPTLPLGR